MNRVVVLVSILFNVGLKSFDNCYVAAIKNNRLHNRQYGKIELVIVHTLNRWRCQHRE